MEGFHRFKRGKLFCIAFALCRGDICIQLLDALFVLQSLLADLYALLLNAESFYCVFGCGCPCCGLKLIKLVLVLF